VGHTRAARKLSSSFIFPRSAFAGVAARNIALPLQTLDFKLLISGVCHAVASVCLRPPAGSRCGRRGLSWEGNEFAAAAPSQADKSPLLAHRRTFSISLWQVPMNCHAVVIMPHR
jgi:hypothetical protein